MLAAMSFERWVDTDIRVLANHELDYPDMQFINEKKNSKLCLQVEQL